MEKKYWDSFYLQDGAPDKQSNFATFIANEYSKFCNLIMDVGCGNGRDSFYFASQGIKSIGIDQSDEVIKKNNNFKESLPSSFIKPEFYKGDYPSFNYEKLNLDKFCIYSRFTLHSINYDEEKIFFENISNLDGLDYIFIEVRSINDSIYGDGTMVGKHEFITSHYRRFIDPEDLHKKLSESFEIIYFIESHGFSKTEVDDPCLIRLVAKKIS